MPVVPFIPLIAAGVGAAATVGASRSANQGQQQAAQASQAATDAATAEQRRQYDLSRGDNAPWLQTGQNALSVLSGLYGLNGPQAAPQTGVPQVNGGPNVGDMGQGMLPGRDGQMTDFSLTNPNLQSELIRNGFNQPNQQNDVMASPMMDPQVNGGAGDGFGGLTPAQPTGGFVPGQPVAPGGQPVVTMGGAPAGSNPNQAPFYASPDYQFRLSEAMRGLTARNAALGIQDSGAAQRSALTLAGNQASGEYNNYANRLAALAGVGQTAAGQNQALGQNYANAFGNLQTNNAQNLATSYQSRANTTGNMWSSLGGIGAGLLNNYAR